MTSDPGPVRSPTGPEARAIGIEAWIYLYPLVTMDLTRRSLTRPDRSGTPRPGAPSPEEPGGGFGGAPMNVFWHARRYPGADFRGVVRPNFDTLYSSAWFDLFREPVVVSAPPNDGRCFMLPVMDMWTDVIASPGTRTTGNGAIDFALCRPDWRGTLPPGVSRIDVPTPTAWLIGRTKTDGPADYGAVHRLQDRLTATPLSSWSWGSTPPRPAAAATPPTPAGADRPGAGPDPDPATSPLVQVNRMDAATFFAYGAELLKRHPPHATDWSMVARLARIGLSPGDDFDLASAPAPFREALTPVPAAGLAELGWRMRRLANVVNGWQMNLDTIGVYGNFYVKRAIVTMVGLGAVPPEDAVYPALMADADGAVLDGNHDYLLHFEPDGLPPVDGFWSVTVYDDQGFPVANPLDRFALGDRDPLVFNADGSLDLYLRCRSPGAGREANWLPQPAGPMAVTMRLYLPRPAVLDGTWAPPPVRRV